MEWFENELKNLNKELEYLKAEKIKIEKDIKKNNVTIRNQKDINLILNKAYLPKNNDQDNNNSHKIESINFYIFKDGIINYNKDYKVYKFKNINNKYTLETNISTIDDFMFNANININNNCTKKNNNDIYNHGCDFYKKNNIKKNEIKVKNNIITLDDYIYVEKFSVYI